MVKFKALIEQFGSMGEKTGWTYFLIPGKIAAELNPLNRKAFRVKGRLDDHPIKQVAVLPIRSGEFMMPLNAAMRKMIRKRKGDKILVELEIDKKAPAISRELLACLKDEPAALAHFQSLAPSHQGYFSKWIQSAKTDQTKAKRIAESVNALAKKFDYGTMIRSLTEKRKT